MNDYYSKEELPVVCIKDHYSPSDIQEFEIRTPDSLSVLPLEKDVISSDLNPLLNVRFVNEIFSYLTECIQSDTFNNLVFNKLILSEYNEEDAVVEWNYNYFRAYFFFNLINPNDSEIGLITNKGKDSFMNRLNLNSDNYKRVIMSLCDFIKKQCFNL